MNPAPQMQDQAWEQALHAAAIFAVDPAATGIVLHGAFGPARDAWLAALASLLGDERIVLRMPAGIDDDRLLGGLDLAASLRSGRPVVSRGILAEADRGVLVLAMAERLSPGTGARLAAAADRSAVRLERDGFTRDLPARVGFVALDESLDDEEGPPAALADRLALRLELAGLRDGEADLFDREAVRAARALLPAVAVAESLFEMLIVMALRLGITSLRAPLHALHVARIAAALRGADEVADEDIGAAVRHVLAPRATILPETAPGQDEAGEKSDAPDETDDAPQESAPPESQPDVVGEGMSPEAMADVVLAAALGQLPGGLLARLQMRSGGRAPAQRSGRAGAAMANGRRGRPIGTRSGDLRSGRLALVDTLRAAAPWQRFRRAQIGEAAVQRVLVTPSDFRIRRYRPRRETSAIFVVDASGSAAVHRLAEAKGAIELLLADCYVRRDSVALVAFRGNEAELILPPTRSLSRAKRQLAALPGGGGTPVASGLAVALTLANNLRRKGRSPLIVLMTDGRANVARGGRLGRALGLEDALEVGREIRAAGIPALAIDTAPPMQTGPEAPTLKISDAMAARYIRLPRADAAHVSQAVRATVVS